MTHKKSESTILDKSFLKQILKPLPKFMSRTYYFNFLENCPHAFFNDCELLSHTIIYVDCEPCVYLLYKYEDKYILLEFFTRTCSHCDLYTSYNDNSMMEIIEEIITSTINRSYITTNKKDVEQYLMKETRIKRLDHLYDNNYLYKLKNIKKYDFLMPILNFPTNLFDYESFEKYITNDVRNLLGAECLLHYFCNDDYYILFTYENKYITIMIYNDEIKYIDFEKGYNYELEHVSDKVKKEMENYKNNNQFYYLIENYNNHIKKSFNQYTIINNTIETLKHSLLENSYKNTGKLLYLNKNTSNIKDYEYMLDIFKELDISIENYS